MVFDSTRDGSTEVYLLDLDTLAVRQITNVSDPEIASRFPDWSPGGSEVVFVREDAHGIGDLYVVEVASSDLRRLTSDPARYKNPAWSLGGDWIAFERAHGEDWHLYLMRPDGSDLRRIEGNNLYQPSWSPGGHHLAVVTGDEVEYYGAVLDFSSSEVRRVTPEGMSVGSVKYSPDGSRIAFDALIDDNFDLFLVGEDGANLQRLTESAAIDARPEWSPDGTKLLFHTTRDFESGHADPRWDDFELYLLDLATRQVERLTENEVFDAHPDWCPPEDR